ncbi:MAG TPA: PHP domain-containing protein [Armatimonadota bacterium]|nr:PHP domain-containing protein [Armatimonadota bacterium]
MAHLDLHLHTTYSDGTLTPEEVIMTAAERGVLLLAITDHDEVEGIAPAQAAASAYGIEVISGVEINTQAGKEDVHILGYGFPVTSPVLLAGLRLRREARVERAKKILARLATLGYSIDIADVLAIAGHGSVGRPHIARALVHAGYVHDTAEAFDRLIGNRCPAYVPRSPFTPEEAVALIHQAGGIASLAHPGKLGDPIRFIKRLKEVDLNAIEAYHSDHSAAVTERLLRWARQFDLGVTGGTDSHGPHGTRVVPIGSVPIPDEVGERFLALLGQNRS